MSDHWWSGRYLDEFVKLKCAPDLLALKLFPNAKEITESMAAFNAVRRFGESVGLKFEDPNTLLFSVGDGSTPRTAAMFAFRSAWTCVSIDPVLSTTKRWDVQRLYTVPLRVEQLEPGWFTTNPITVYSGDKKYTIPGKASMKIVVVAVHSHANLPNALKCVGGRADLVVALPCCVQQKLWLREDWMYRDLNIASPCREVRIWCNVNENDRPPVEVQSGQKEAT